MNVYKPDTPRLAFGLAAAAMAAITMALMVVLPAQLEDAGAAGYTLANSAPAPVRVAAVHRGLELTPATACEDGMLVRIAQEMQLTCIELSEPPVSTASLHDLPERR
jgi:hypothetical protein